MNVYVHDAEYVSTYMLHAYEYTYTYIYTHIQI
jgi:hypothetical protein